MSKAEKALPKDIKGFRQWYGVLSSLLNLDPDPNPIKHSYNYQEYYKNNAKGREVENIKEMLKGSQHFPDTYKLPTHPTFSNESIYSDETMQGGSWKGERFTPSLFNFLMNSKRGTF